MDERLAACAIGLFLLGSAGGAFAQPVDGDEYRSEEVAGWEIRQPAIDPAPEPFAVASGASMERRTEDFRIEYEVEGGIQRSVSVQRLNCGEATDANGGAMYSLPIYLTGSTVEAADAARAAAREADSAFDDACPARPEALEAALAGMETAIVTVERWAIERPLPAAEAWSRGFWAIERTEPLVTIRYNRSPGGEPERELAVEAECGQSYFSESRMLPPPARPEDRRRAAVALAELLGRAAAQCRLAPGQPARLAAGFEEALTRSAAEE